MKNLGIENTLVDGCNVLADQGQGDLIWGHASVRVDKSSSSILMKPAGLGLDEIHRTDLITINEAGGKTEGSRPVHAEVFIHTEIFRLRPDVQAVVHTHPIHAVAFSALNRPLLPIGHEGAMFHKGLPVFTETSDLIVNATLGQATAKKLGNANALILQNHGIVTVGRSVEEAVMTAIMLEKACKTQLLAESSYEIKAHSSIEDAQAKNKRIYNENSLKAAFQYCVRCCAPKLR